jgi:hypothetical protein
VFFASPCASHKASTNSSISGKAVAAAEVIAPQDNKRKGKAARRRLQI